MIVPLAARGRVLGSMTLLSTRAGPPLRARRTWPSPRRWRSAARWRSTTRACTTRAERSLSLLDTVFSTAPGRARARRPRPALRARQRDLRRLQRPPVEDLVGRTVAELLRRGRPSGGRRRRRAIDRVLDTGRGGARPRADHRRRRRRARHWNVSFTPVTRPRRLGHRRRSSSVVDVTERRRPARGRARRARARGLPRARRGDPRRVAGLRGDAGAPSRRSRSPRWPTGAPSASSTTPGVLQEVATAHVDDGQRELGRELSRRFPPDPERRQRHATASRARARPRTCREVTDEMLVAGIPDPEQLALVRRLGPALGRSSRR